MTWSSGRFKLTLVALFFFLAFIWIGISGSGMAGQFDLGPEPPDRYGDGLHHTLRHRLPI